MIYLSGVGPRQPDTNTIPGGPIQDAEGNKLDYDIKAQTRAVVENIARILEEAGSSIDKVLDVTSYLVDMDRDFQGYNEVWAETLGKGCGCIVGTAVTEFHFPSWRCYRFS